MDKVIFYHLIVIMRYDGFLSMTPLVSFHNADVQKSEIIKEIKGKAGIYRWVNTINGKSYVGSSVDLAKRLYRYFSLAHITAQSKHSAICRALIKYGYGNFRFEILEYCDKKETFIREQYFLDLLKPEYNILKLAGSPLGYKHTDEAKAKLRGAKNFSPEHALKLKIHIDKLNSEHSIAINVLDTENNTTVEYASIRLTCRELNCADVTVKKYIGSNKLFRNRYIISSKINKND